MQFKMCYNSPSLTDKCHLVGILSRISIKHFLMQCMQNMQICSKRNRDGAKWIRKNSLTEGKSSWEMLNGEHRSFSVVTMGYQLK